MDTSLKTSEKAGSVGVTETNYFTFAQLPHELAFENGEKLGPVTLAYETYGTLNRDRSNAILIVHALSGDAHVAGIHKDSKKLGWWDEMVGPGKAFDTDKYFVICSNIIGGCKGSTGPSSLNPKTNKPYGLDFPLITIGDMINVQKHLVDYLGIERLLSVVGGSMGGMQVLEWMVSHPERIRSAIPISTALRQSSLMPTGRMVITTAARYQQTALLLPGWSDILLT